MSTVFTILVITLCILAFCHVFGRRDCYDQLRNHGKGGGE